MRFITAASLPPLPKHPSLLWWRTVIDADNGATAQAAYRNRKTGEIRKAHRAYRQNDDDDDDDGDDDDDDDDEIEAEEDAREELFDHFANEGK